MRKLLISLAFVIALSSGMWEAMNSNWPTSLWALCAAAWIYSFAKQDSANEIALSLLGKAISRLVELEGREKTERFLVGEE